MDVFSIFRYYLQISPSLRSAHELMSNHFLCFWFCWKLSTCSFVNLRKMGFCLPQHKTATSIAFLLFVSHQDFNWSQDSWSIFNVPKWAWYLWLEENDCWERNSTLLTSIPNPRKTRSGKPLDPVEGAGSCRDSTANKRREKRKWVTVQNKSIEA